MTKHNSFILALFFLSTLLFSCDAPDSVPKESAQKVVAIIFCDITASVDSSSIHQVARNAAKLLLKFPQGSILYFLPIDETPFVEPILKFNKPLIGSKVTDRIKNKRKIADAARILHNKILSRYREINADIESQNFPRSCIIQTLEVAHRIFLQFPSRNQYAYELIYLSDMLEECEDSPVGKIFLTDKNYNHAEKKIRKYSPAFSLSDVNLTVIAAFEKHREHTTYINYEKRKAIWKQIFMKAGFSEEQFNNSHFLPGIPARFDNF